MVELLCYVLKSWKFIRKLAKNARQVVGMWHKFWKIDSAKHLVKRICGNLTIMHAIETIKFSLLWHNKAARAARVYREKKSLLNYRISIRMYFCWKKCNQSICWNISTCQWSFTFGILVLSLKFWKYIKFEIFKNGQ